MYFFGYYVLNVEPTILSFLTSNADPGLYPPPEWLKPVAVLEHIPWWHGRVSTMLKRKIKQIRINRTKIDHHLMVHARDEDSLRRLLGVRGALVSQNIYIGESVFKPEVAGKTYDAIYVAQLKPFKRLPLAREVRRLFVACGGDLPGFCPELSHAEYNVDRLERGPLSAIMNASFCSLALSAEEGQMLASFESLLCGIPMVSTPSRGGRDEFFDADNAIIVPPESGAVAAAVGHWKAHVPDPEAIRARTIERLADHRRRFCEYVSGLIQEKGGGHVAPSRLYDRYFSAPGGMAERFIWANTFDDPSQLRRVPNS
jgi:glycosyltransferase involved in cell wall biosynthesis